MKTQRMGSVVAVGIAAGITMGMTAAADASLLDIVLADSPDITTGFMDVAYNAGTNAFTVSGFALTLYDGSATNNITNGLFNLTATIDSSGSLVGGSFEIQGEVSGFGPPSLLTGDLLDFGFMPAGGNFFEFTFQVTGGDLAVPGYFGSPGDLIGGIKLTAAGPGTDFNGDWTQSFLKSGQGFANVAPLPAPAGIAVFMLGLFGARRRRE